MQNKQLKRHLVKPISFLKRHNCLNQISLKELKGLDFNKSEYDYFIENCNFTDRQIDILNLRRKGVSILAISSRMFISERTVNREIKKIKNKILKVI